MAGAGSVAWMFEKKGYIVVSKSTIDEDKLMGVALDAGAEDMVVEDENYAVTTTLAGFLNVKKALDDANIKTETAEVTMIPKSTVKLAGEEARKVLDLISAIEEHDDVQNVYANFDIPDDMIKE